MRRLWMGSPLLLTLLTATACGDGAGPDASPQLQLSAEGAVAFTGTPLDSLRDSVAVKVTDLAGRPVAGVQVAWRTDDGGHFDPKTATTGSDGIARARWTLGRHIGVQHANAAILGATAAPVVMQVTADAFRARLLSTGFGEHNCAIDAAGTVFCWGRNESGELGDGTSTDSRTPVRTLLSRPAIQVVTSSGESTCALTTDGDIYCWGANYSGQLGNGGSASSSIPVRVSLPSGPYRQITGNYAAACAVAASGAAYCWGLNHHGSFGNGTAEGAVHTPTPVAGGIAWQQIALGDDRSCGVQQGGQVFCWGVNNGGLGLGFDSNTVTPLPLAAGPLMDSLTVSGYHQCGMVLATHAIWCWGFNNMIGFLGSGWLIPAPYPISGSLEPTEPAFQSVHSSFKPTFALGTDGKAYWWGPPSNSTGGPPFVPTVFSGDVILQALGHNYYAACGVEAGTGVVYCWNDFDWDGTAHSIRAFPAQ